MTRAVVIHPVLRQSADGPSREPESRLAEAVGLTEALDLEVVDARTTAVTTPRAGTLFTAGKLTELGERIGETEADLAIVDGPLTPIQQRNLEREWDVKVLDRTALILEIFGDRASTREGVLQVELAHLEYQRSRLVRSWTHLERQRGGVGFMGGPGETQIEADRRQLADRIVALRKRLDKIARTRSLQRAKRRKAPYPVVALVGYTNAGKSTLFNRLTDAEVLAKDMLFATLDPTMRAVKTPRGRRIVLSDTVGFISDLPTQLVTAFRATLEEVIHADVVVHVRNVADPETDAQAQDVRDVLTELGLDETALSRVIEAHNKIDLLPEADRRAARNVAARDGAHVTSATTGEGVDALMAAIERRLSEDADVFDAALPASAGGEIAWLYEQGCVVERVEAAEPDGADAGGSIVLRLSMSALDRGRFAKRFGWAIGPEPDLRDAAE